MQKFALRASTLATLATVAESVALPAGAITPATFALTGGALSMGSSGVARAADAAQSNTLR
jgi:hypothetical protein